MLINFFLICYCLLTLKYWNRKMLIFTSEMQAESKFQIDNEAFLC